MKKIKVMVLALFLVVGFGAQSSFATISANDKSNIEGIVKEYILKHPEIIIQSINTLQQKEREQQQGDIASAIDRNYKDLTEDKSDPGYGPQDSDLTIVEFFDYNCGYCKRSYINLKKALKENKNLHVILKELPILHPSSTTASQVALGAKMQGKYNIVHDALLSHKGILTNADIMNLAKQSGVDMQKLKEDMKSPAIIKKLMDNRRLAQELNIRGTPAFIIGKTFYGGAFQSYDALMQAIAEAQQASK